MCQRPQHSLDDALFKHFFAAAAERVQRFIERNAWLQAAVLTQREVHADVLFGVFAAADVIGTGARLDRQPRLQSARVVEVSVIDGS